MILDCACASFSVFQSSSIDWWIYCSIHFSNYLSICVCCTYVRLNCILFTSFNFEENITVFVIFWRCVCIISFILYVAWSDTTFILIAICFTDYIHWKQICKHSSVLLFVGNWEDWQQSSQNTKHGVRTKVAGVSWTEKGRLRTW